jgi:hypothetical protein
MKGTTPTKADKALWDALSQLGCIACHIEGSYTQEVSIHHIDGRTKPGAHQRVLPLCAGHHQDGTGRPGLVAVHPWKARFENLYGKQADLLAKAKRLIGQAASNELGNMARRVGL